MTSLKASTWGAIHKKKLSDGKLFALIEIQAFQKCPPNNEIEKDSSRKNMPKYKLEYLWLDGYQPVPNLRGKTKIVSEAPQSVDDCEMWGFDGSSTQQAEGSSSDCMLKPVALYPDAARENGFIVMCEVMMPDGSAHPSNARATIADDEGAWFGLEQEYFLYQDGRPLGWPERGIRTLKVNTTPVSATLMSVISLVKSLNSTWNSVWKLGSIMRVSTLRWPKGSGSFRFSPKDPRNAPMTCGLLATC